MPGFNEQNTFPARRDLNNIIDIPEKHKDCTITTGIADDIENVKKLDDLAFGSHEGISEDDLQQIIDNGSIILLKDDDGNLIGEAQLITQQAPMLKYRLAENEAYAYGTAIHPDRQKQGLGQITGQAQKELAKEASKEVMVLTVRAENMASLRSRFKQGYKIEDFDPEYYDSMENGGARVIMKNKIEVDSASGEKLLELIKNNSISTFDGQNINEELLAIPINCGDEIDINANQQIETLTRAGYKGIWIFKDSEIKESGDNEQGLFIFKKEREEN